MGVCDSNTAIPNIFPQLYSQYRPQIVQMHVISMMLLEYFKSRRNSLAQEAKSDINQIISQTFGQVEAIQQRIESLYEVKKSILCHSESASTNTHLANQIKQQTEAQLMQIRQIVAEIRDILGTNFENLEQQVLNYLSEQMSKIQIGISKGLVEIQYSDQLQKQHVDTFIQRLRSSLGKRFMKSCLDIQNQVKAALCPQNLRNSLAKLSFNTDEIIKKLNSIEEIIASIKRKFNKQKSSKTALKLIIQFSQSQIDETRNEKEKSLNAYLAKIAGEIIQSINRLKQRFETLNTQLGKSQQTLKRQRSKLTKAKRNIVTSSLSK